MGVIGRRTVSQDQPGDTEKDTIQKIIEGERDGTQLR
jgi:hypothetical protein